MYKFGSKFCSTPEEIEFKNASLSISDINPSTTDSASQKSTIRQKKIERVYINGKEKVSRKRKRPKFKELVRKVRRRNWIESRTSDGEWEVQCSVNDNCHNKGVDTPLLFKSPERVRDLGVEKNYSFSPPLICPRGRNLSAIENEAANKEEEVLFLGEDKMETNTLPIFERSKVVRTYSSKKTEKCQKRSLVNKGSANWLVDLKMPTATANLLWENYMQNLSTELLPRYRINNIERCDSRVERNDKDNDADNDITLDMLSEERRQLLKHCKRLCKIKGSCNRKNIKLPVEVHRVVYVSDDDLPSKSDVHKSTRPKEKLVTIRSEFDEIWNISDNIIADLREEDDTLMTYNNKTYAKSKRKKNKKADSYLSQKTSNNQIKSVEKFKAVCYKRSDGNFCIIKN